VDLGSHLLCKYGWLRTKELKEEKCQIRPQPMVWMESAMGMSLVQFARADPISSIHQQGVTWKQNESTPKIISNISTTTSEESQNCNTFHLDAYDIYRLRSSRKF
jgi:hypothetical protein